jgi:hypothetical protein
MSKENETPSTRSEKAIRLHSVVLAANNDDVEAALEQLCYEVVDLLSAVDDEPGDGFSRRVRSAS